MNKKLVIALAGGLALGFVSATSYAEPPPAAPAPGSDTKDVKKDDKKTDKTAPGTPAPKEDVKGGAPPAGKK